MNIDFKKPKYVIPLILLPFMFLLFYAYKSISKDEVQHAENRPELQSDIAGVSDDIKNKNIDNKLDAFKDSYKEGDGYTAVGNLGDEQEKDKRLEGRYSDREKYLLDSIEMNFQNKYGPNDYSTNNRGKYAGTIRDNGPKSMSAYQENRNNQISQEDKDLAIALSNLTNKKTSPEIRVNSSAKKYEDPMVLFKEQMRVIDSIGKINDPDEKTKKKQEDLLKIADNVAIQMQKLGVTKASNLNEDFNTVSASKKNNFIRAILDQSVTGFAGSRVRIRVLEDINVGKHLINKGTYLYAIISGFDDQRVKLTVFSIMMENKILPVKLTIYDLDGMPGLFVPGSSFRSFTKEVSDIGSTVQMQQNPENANQLYMSAISKLFTSTSSAVSKLIRQNKANLKYSTNVYLIDPDELIDQQKNY